MLAALLSLFGTVAIAGVAAGSRNDDADSDRPSNQDSDPLPPVLEADAAVASTEQAAAREQAAQQQPVQQKLVQQQPVQQRPVQELPVQELPVQERPVQEQPVQERPVQEQPVQERPVQERPVQEQPVQERPVQELPVQETDQTPAPVGPANIGQSVTAGRVTTLTPENHSSIDSIRIIDGPASGNVSVNPDNTFAVVLPDSGTRESLKFSYEVSYKDGSTQAFTNQNTVVAGSQGAGWGQGDFYMLETDDNGDVIVETGEDHRPVYISGSEDALSRADIAALENIKVSDITNAWLVANPEYGGSEGMALNAEAGMAVWYATTEAGDHQTSNWLLFEKGYTYSNLGRVVGRGASGEDELHPLHITSYGEGDDPIIDSTVNIFQDKSENIVFSDLHFGQDVITRSASNVIFEDVRFGASVSIQNGSGITIRDSVQFDVVAEEPAGGGAFYTPHLDRISGLYAAKVDGLLLEGNLWDQIGWEVGYSQDGAVANGQPPSKYSQNVYIQDSTLDVTFRDNITMRAASFGAQLRGGAFVEDNLFLENQAAVNLVGGDYNGSGPVGNYSFFTGNVVTSAQYNEAVQIGAKSLGIENIGQDTSFYENIVTHLADPNNPSELTYKLFTGDSLRGGGENAFYDDTIIYNWHGSEPVRAGRIQEQNTEGLDRALLDQTTIQNYAKSLLGDPNATIADLGDYLRTLEGNDTAGTSNADVINSFFQKNFGISTDDRLDATTLRFVPNEIGDGVRWDNRINWDSEDLPGTITGDSVDLGGNWVTYGGTTRLEDFDFGDGGTLNVTHGRLTVEGTLEAGARGGTFDIAESGQVWLNGYEDQDRLSLNLDGGRFVNTGALTGTTETTISDGQAILATDGARFDVTGTSSLEIQGSEARVGFDGNTNGTAILRFGEDARLSMIADENGFSTIEEFDSGRFSDTADVQSGINLNSSKLYLDISKLGGATGEFRLMEVDGLIGQFSAVELAGLGSNQNAEIVVDYETDTVSLNISTATNGARGFDLSTIGSQEDGLSGTSLWRALTKDFPVADDTPAEPDDDDVELALAG